MVLIKVDFPRPVCPVEGGQRALARGPEPCGLQVHSSKRTDTYDIELKASLEQLPLNLRGDAVEPNVALGKHRLGLLSVGDGSHCVERRGTITGMSVDMNDSARGIVSQGQTRGCGQFRHTQERRLMKLEKAHPIQRPRPKLRVVSAGTQHDPGHLSRAKPYIAEP